MAQAITNKIYLIGFVHFSLFYIVVFAIPTTCLLILLCSSPCCCACCICKNTRCCKKLKKMLFNITQWLFWFLKKETTKDGDPVFIVAGYTAPVCYTYFLLYSFTVFSIHSCFSLFANAIFLSYKNATSNDYNQVYYDYLFSPSSCDKDDVIMEYSYTDQKDIYYCFQIEVQFLKGLESATITFTVSVFFFAILTILLLKFSGWRKPSKKCCTCRICKVIITLSIQAVFICLPRILYFVYVTYVLNSADSNKPNRKIEEGEQMKFTTISPGMLDEDTFYVLAAICDAIATSMLTPWYCFKKKKNEDKDCSIPGEQNTHTFSPSEP